MPAGRASNTFTQSGELLGFAGDRLLELKFSGGILGDATAYQSDGRGNGAGYHCPGDGRPRRPRFPRRSRPAWPWAKAGRSKWPIPLAVLGNADVGARR